MVALFFVTVTAFGLSVFTGSAMVAVFALIFGLVVAFVLAVAWMRPASSPTEHHPKVDRLFGDTNP